jgi:hypothetical protein
MKKPTPTIAMIAALGVGRGAKRCESAQQMSQHQLLKIE